MKRRKPSSHDDDESSDQFDIGDPYGGQRLVNVRESTVTTSNRAVDEECDDDNTNNSNKNNSVVDDDSDGMDYRADEQRYVFPASSTSTSHIYTAATTTSAAYCFGIGGLTPVPCLQREIGRMPQEQIQKVNEDLLGLSLGSNNKVADVVNEESIVQLLVEIEALDDQYKSAYHLAIELSSPTHVLHTSGLAVAFLRSVEGSAKRAAKRFVQHFQTKLELFGQDRLCRPILLSDLDQYDMEALESGGFQILPQKDRAGRPILFGRYTCMRYRSVTNMVRALWYVWSTMAEDEAHQKSGIVAIGFENGKTPLERLDGTATAAAAAQHQYNDDYNTSADYDTERAHNMYDLHAQTHSYGGFDRDLARGILRLPLSLPIRPVGYHITADDAQWQGISDMVMVTLCKLVRLRLRFHFGTMQETKYKLMTSGIPVDAIPVGDDGEVDLTNHLRWIEQRRQIELERTFSSPY